MFKEAEAQIDQLILDSISRIAIKPVLYDQITKFENGDNSYPFQRRKSKFPDINFEALYPRNLGMTGTIKNYKMTLQKSVVCLDNNIFSQLFIYDDKLLNKCDHEVDFEVLAMSEGVVEDIISTLPAYLMITLTLDNQKQFS